MDRAELVTMSPLVLAYLGDTVFESHIREYLITKNINKKVNDWKPNFPGATREAP